MLMSSAVAGPASTIRMAASKYGTSSALTTNSVRSGAVITVLPRGPVMSARAGAGGRRHAMLAKGNGPPWS